jgi:hypothetical protein
MGSKPEGRGFESRPHYGTKPTQLSGFRAYWVLQRERGRPGGESVKHRPVAVIRVEAAGASNKEMRVLALNSIDLANKLQHGPAIERW